MNDLKWMCLALIGFCLPVQSQTMHIYLTDGAIKHIPLHSISKITFDAPSSMHSGPAQNLVWQSLKTSDANGLKLWLSNQTNVLRILDSKGRTLSTKKGK